MNTDQHAKKWHGLDWIVVGGLYGLLIRAIFGLLPHPYLGTMSVAFLVATPMVVGALTVYGLRESNQSFLSYIFRPWASIGLMLIGCAITLLEGAICVAILAPLFLICGSIGGLIMGLVLRFLDINKSQISVVAALPFLLLLGEAELPLHGAVYEIRESVEVLASPKEIWSQILEARNIQKDELPFSFAHLIGVPKPIEGINVMTPNGETRFSRWERGVNFQGIVVSRSDYQSITWRYAFNDHSFPKGTMDEHVEIGGKYFDLKDTTFNLYPLGTGRTKLEIVAHFRVTSAINAYAVPVAAFLGRDFVQTILGLYKKRSEHGENFALTDHKSKT